MQFIDFETVIYIAWRISFVCVFGTVALFAAVLLVRRYFDGKAKRAAAFREMWESILTASLDRIPLDIPVIEEKDQLTFLIVWNYFQELLLDESKENLLELAKRVELPRIALKILRKRNVKSRLLAVNTLGWLRDQKSWGILEKLLNNPDTTFSTAVARALINLNPDKAADLILPQIASRPDWAIDRCADLVRLIGMEQLEHKLIRQINITPRHQLPKVIRLLELLLPTQSDPVVESLLRKYDDKEIIFACLAVYRDIDNLQRVRHFLTHSDWEVRMQAAICLGKFGSEDEIDYLVSATADPEWWVRYRSAQALAKIPAVTIETLKEIAAHHANRFSHDVILRIVTEREVAESCGLSY